MSSKFLQDRDKTWTKLTTELVSQVGGEIVSGDEENLQVATQFALSNFKEHTFYEFNDKKCIQDFQNLIKSFTIHSLENVSLKLTTLLNTTLKQQPKSTPTILKTLMLLAQSPLEGIWERLPILMTTKPRPLSSKTQMEQNAIAAREHNSRVVAWNRQVKENGDEEEDEWMREFKASANSDSDFTDDEFDLEENATTQSKEDEEAEYKRRRQQEFASKNSKNPTSPETTQSLPTTPIQSIPLLSLPSEPTTQARPASVRRSYSFHAPNTLVHALTKDWTTNHGTIYPYILVDERHIVREAFSSLLGYPGDLFEFNNNTFVLKKNICLAHVSPMCLIEMLQPVLKTATSIRRVRDFCTVHADPTSKMRGGTIWQSFVSGVYHMLIEYEQHVEQAILLHLDHGREKIKIQKKNKNTSGILTLKKWHSTMLELSILLIALVNEAPLPLAAAEEKLNRNVDADREVDRDVAHGGYGMKDVDDDYFRASTTRSATTITTTRSRSSERRPVPQRRHVCQVLNLISTKLSISLSTSEGKEKTSIWLWTLLTNIYISYLSILGPFINYGILQDPHHELFLYRTKKRQKNDHPNSTNYTNDSSFSDDNDETNETNDEDDDEMDERGDHGWSNLFQIDDQAIPSLLHSFSNDILLIGKTQYFRSKMIQFTSSTTTSMQPQWTALISSIESSRTKNEPLLICFERMLRPHINRQVIASSHHMMHLLTRDLDLGAHLKKAQEIYMLSNIDMMENFINNVFDRVGSRLQTSNRFNQGESNVHAMNGDDDATVTYWLRRAMMTHGRSKHSNGGRLQTTTTSEKEQETKRWSASFDTHRDGSPSNTVSSARGGASPVSASVDALNGLEVKYNAPWPINIVLDNEALVQYNHILRWLLQVKRCKFQLDAIHTLLRQTSRRIQKECLSSDDGNGGGNARVMHRDKDVMHRLHQCSMIVSEFLHFVNNVHVYMMDRAVRTEWSNFTEDIDNASKQQQSTKNSTNTTKAPSSINATSSTKAPSFKKTSSSSSSSASASSSSSTMSLDDVRERHMYLLNSITEQCLLHDRSRVAKAQVVKIFNFAHRVCHAVEVYMARATEPVEFTSDRDVRDRVLEGSMSTITNVHGNFKRTVRFLIVLMKSHVRNSHGASLFMESIMTTIDFSDYYSQRRGK